MLGSTAGNLQTDLATLQGQLADARVRYTPGPSGREATGAADRGAVGPCRGASRRRCVRSRRLIRNTSASRARSMPRNVRLAALADERGAGAQPDLPVRVGHERGAPESSRNTPT